MDRGIFKQKIKAEFSDLLLDIDHVEERYRGEFDRLDIGQYVFLENRAFLEKERDCIAMIIDEMDAMDASAYPDGESMAEGARKLVRRHIAEMEYPPAIESLVERKLAKALRGA